MQRITPLVLVAAVLGICVVPSWANHSTPTGINCSNFTFQEEAQAYFELHPGDPEGLDGPIGPGFTGIEGVACENLPRPGTTTTTVVVTTTTATTLVDGTGSGGSTTNSGAASNASATTTTVQPTTSVQPTSTTTEVHGRVATINAGPATASQGRVLALTG